MSARRLAVRVIEKVQKEGAFLAQALANELDKSGLELRDRALATELAYGVVRTEGYLLWRLGSLLDLRKTDERVLRELLLAVYQIDFLERVPARAAVSEAVAAVRRVQGPRVGGFVNAVLRRLLTSDDKTSLAEASYVSLPEWLRSKMESSLDAVHVRSLVDPERGRGLTLRVPRGSALPGTLAAEVEPISSCEGAFRFLGRGDPRARAEYGQGHFSVQELGSQLIAHLLEVTEGARVLDVCAGRGNKSLVLAELAGREGRVVATDLHPAKLSVLKSEEKRLKGERAPIETRVWDATTQPPSEFLGAFDFVLVDAPCTGVGTLRRRPEIARRLVSEDPARLSALQEAILRAAALTLRPGGQLLFSTCSVLPEEGEQILDRVSDVLVASPKRGEIWTPLGGAAPFFRLLPQIHGSDGYFVARLELREK